MPLPFSKIRVTCYFHGKQVNNGDVYLKGAFSTLWLEQMNQMEQSFSASSENRTTLRGVPKFMEISLRELTFFRKFSEFLVE